MFSLQFSQLVQGICLETIDLQGMACVLVTIRFADNELC